MKTTILIFLLIGVVESAVLAGTEFKIPVENRVVLRGTWTPAPEEITKAMKAIQTFLTNAKGSNESERAEIKKILANSSKYCVQFTATHSNGRERIIRCNFFPASDIKDFLSQWKTREVVACDGGFWFWQIEYDADEDKCLNFRVNGEA